MIARYGLLLGCFLVVLGTASGAAAAPLPPVSLAGPEEAVPFPAAAGLQWTPDGNLTFLRADGLIHLWLAANGGQVYYFRGPTLDALQPAVTAAGGQAAAVFGPSGAGFDRDYAAPGTVLRAANGRDLLMIYHAEDHDCDPTGQRVRVGIGLARSTDGGRTWARQGQIIAGRDLAPGCPTRFNGAGYPSAVLSPDGRYIYLYYMDWDATGTHGPDEVHLARAPVASDGAPGAWQKYAAGRFAAPGLGGWSEPVLHRPPPVETTVWAGNPHVSYNTLNGSYLAVVQSHQGFHTAFSPDGIAWSVPALLWPFPVNGRDLQPGNLWYSYPSLLSPDASAGSVTTGQAYLYYAAGIYQVTPHTMVRRAVRIGQRAYLPLLLRAGGTPASTPTPTATLTPTLSRTPTATLTPTATPPPPQSIPAGSIFLPPAGWTWHCAGDLAIAAPGGEFVPRYDSVAQTGLVISLQPDSRVRVLAPWGGSCRAYGPAAAAAGLAQMVAEALAGGCGSGCTSVHVLVFDPAGGIVADEWRP